MLLSTKLSKLGQESRGTSEDTEAPSNNLWIGNLSSDVTQCDLVGLFAQFGPLDGVTPYSARSYAFVLFKRMEDARAAKNAFQGTLLRGNSIKIEFARAYLQSSVGTGDGQPSNILLIGYPSSVHIDEQMLHNAMILFGEIERIKCYPSKCYSIVEFRSMDEARCAKEGLQGRLFNDPRITIMYLNSELAPGKGYPGFYHGSKGVRPDLLLSELPFRPLQMDVFGHNRPMVPNNFPGQLPIGGSIVTNAPMRPYGPQGSQEPLISSCELNDLGSHLKYQDGSSKTQMGPNWKRPSPPAPGILPSLSVTRPTKRFSSVAWDAFDTNQVQSDSKRSRIDGALFVDNVPFPLRSSDDCGLGPEKSYGFDPVIDGGGSGPYANIQGNIHPGPEGSRISSRVPSPVQPDIDHIWRGIIAKGGTPVCYARCLPVGKGIKIQFPEVVDCSARTGLDMLTKHYADAIGFEIVFFLPDSEDDFASYTEFLCYLSTNNRAGVAKFVDGTTLFLVPPFDFLTKVLKVTGPERLYGVVLKFPPVPSSTPVQQSSHLPTSSIIYTDRQHFSYSQAEYGLIPAKKEPVLPMDYNRLLHEKSEIRPKPIYPATSVPPSVKSVHPDYASGCNASASQAGVTLTPELVATLASLLPSASQSSATDGTKSAVGSSTVNPSFSPIALSDGNQSYLWKQDGQIAEASTHPAQQLGSVYNLQSPPSNPYPPASTPGHTAQIIPRCSYIQDSSASQQQQSADSSRSRANIMTPSQSGQIDVFPQVQQYRVEVSPGTQKGYGVMQEADASGLYSSQVFQQPNTSVASYDEVYGANPSQQQTFMPYTADKVNRELENTEVQLSLFGAGEGASEVEADKNHRYQSTLQFAASLLRQIQQQQQQQQHQTQGGCGPGSQQ